MYILIFIIMSKYAEMSIAVSPVIYSSLEACNVSGKLWKNGMGINGDWSCIRSEK